MVIIQMILTNRVIKRWQEYNDAEDINDAGNYCGHKWLHRDTSGFFQSYEYERNSMLKPDHLFLSSQSLAIFSWFTYLSCYTLYLVMLVFSTCKEEDGAFYSIPWLFLSYCISFVIAYGYGKLLGYVLTLVWYIIKYTCKILWFLFRVFAMTPVFFIDDLLSGKLMDDILSKRKPKSIKYLGESLEVFNIKIVS